MTQGLLVFAAPPKMAVSGAGRMSDSAPETGGELQTVERKIVPDAKLARIRHGLEREQTLK